MCIVCASNYTQTIHKPYIEAFKTLHWGVQNPTQRVFAKLYTKRNTNPTFCFWTRISRMEFRTRKVRKEWMVRKVRMEFRTRMERMVRIVRNVCDERNESNERYERKTGNGNRRWRASSLPRAAPKIQQFWAFFQRFDINIFNFREHFPPPNFAYSAHNFSLPSSNFTLPSPNFSLPSPNFSRMRF